MSVVEEQKVETEEVDEATSENEETEAGVEAGDAEGPHTVEEANDSEEASAASDTAALNDKIADLEKCLNDKNDQHLRLNAEFENFKRRMTKENADRLKYYHIGLIKELLPALDSLEHAIDHGKKDNATVDAILEGIEMVYKINQEALGKFSVKKIEAKGEAFDPNIHQAVGTVESEEVPEDHVVDEFQVGYLLHDRVIRPAMVRVSKKQ